MADTIVTADGSIIVRFDDGTTFTLPDADEWGVKPSLPNWHEYWSTQTVGRLGSGSSVDKAWDSLLSSPAPGTLLGTNSARTGSITDTFGPGGVQHVVNSNSNTLANVTLGAGQVPGFYEHPLHPGAVIRHVTVRDGFVVIDSVGVGNFDKLGPFSVPVNDLMGSFFFGGPDGQTLELMAGGSIGGTVGNLDKLRMQNPLAPTKGPVSVGGPPTTVQTPAGPKVVNPGSTYVPPGSAPPPAPKPVMPPSVTWGPMASPGLPAGGGSKPAAPVQPKLMPNPSSSHRDRQQPPGSGGGSQNDHRDRQAGLARPASCGSGGGGGSVSNPDKMPKQRWLAGRSGAAGGVAFGLRRVRPVARIQRCPAPSGSGFRQAVGRHGAVQMGL